MMGVWIRLLPLLLLTACANTEYVYVKSMPPTVLLEDCSVPELAGERWRDVAVYAVELRSTLEYCNQDKRLLRRYFED